MDGKLLIDDNYLLEKMPGKGGWTYLVLPESIRNKKAPFGGMKVKGYLDSYEHYCTLMPMANGKCFMPIKAAIRKAIGKEGGAWVKVTLYADYIINDTEVSDELLLCLQDNPEAHKTFLSYTQAEQDAFTTWVSAAKTEEAIVDRITKTLEMLERKQKLKA